MQPLKIMILCRAVVDSTMPLAHDSKHPDMASASWVLNPFDEVATEAAVQLRAALAQKESSGAGVELLVVGYADGPGVSAAERALSLGGDRALLLEAIRPSSTPHPLDSRAQAEELLALLRQEQPDLLLMGKMAYGQEQGEFAPLMAALAGWPLAVACSELAWASPECSEPECSEPDADPTYLDFTQKRVERWHKGRVALPAVVSVELDLAAPRYVSLPSLVAARRKPKAQVSASASAYCHQQGASWSFAAPTTKQVQKLTGISELVAVIRQMEQA